MRNLPLAAPERQTFCEPPYCAPRLAITTITKDIIIGTISIGINFDTGNSYLCGHDPYVWLERVADRLVHLHAKDISISQSAAQRRGQITGTPVGCACGEGVIDWARIIAICKKCRRNIVLSVECGTVPQAATSIAHLRALL